MNKKFWFGAACLALLAFAIPFEHKYDKLFRFYSLTLIPDGLSLSPRYDKKIYFYASDLIALTLCLLGLSWYRIPWQRFFGHPLWIVWLCAALSIFLSPFSHYPVSYIRLLQLFTPIALFSFLAFAFKEEERSKLTGILFTALVLAGLCQASIAIVQYFHQAPLGLRVIGETSQISTFEVPNQSLSALDSFLGIQHASVRKMRAAGTLPHANVLGGFLFLSLLCTYALSQRRSLYLWAIPLQVFALFLSFSRSALFAWILATALWLFWNRRKSVGWVVAISFALSFALLHEQIIHRGGIVNYNGLAKNSDSIRVHHQNLSVQILRSAPLFGLGYGQFSERAADFFPPGTPSYVKETAPHNIFLFLACETGLISLFAFLSFLAILGWAALRSFPTVEITTCKALLAGFLFIGLCDFYPILFQQGKLMLFLTLGLLATHLRKPSLQPVTI